MRVLVIGGGGREHALAWKLAQSPRVTQVLVAPGNPGTAGTPKCLNRPVAVDDLDGLCALAQNERVDLTVVGPEVPLALGLADRFAALGLRCFGPTRAAAELEHSKAFAKDFMFRHGIPTAASVTVANMREAERALSDCAFPIVLKADGLAAGKGVVIAQSHAEALEAARGMLEEELFGAAGHRVVIEEFVDGEELSFMVMVAHGHILPLADSRDHKRRDDGDQGPNTGGMGAYSPVAAAAPLHGRILQEVIAPVVAGLAAEGRPYTGFLYAGLMLQGDRIYVLEFNCRLGDPETQVVLPRLRSDLSVLLDAALAGRLAEVEARWDPRVAITVVLAAPGYPGAYTEDLPIEGLAPVDPQAPVFHMGTRLLDGAVVSAGGRVLSVGALGRDLKEARALAYAAVARIHFTGGFCRQDIGMQKKGTL